MVVSVDSNLGVTSPMQETQHRHPHSVISCDSNKSTSIQCVALSHFQSMNFASCCIDVPNSRRGVSKYLETSVRRKLIRSR
jgi:hypothetical protein